MPMSARILQQLALRHLVDAHAVDEDAAGVRAQQAERQLEDHRLARAADAPNRIRMSPFGTVKLRSFSTT